MTPAPTLFHALLRPCVLQILRSTGYHSTKPAVLDSLTDLATAYLSLLCERTALHAAQNDGCLGPSIVDVRMALQDVGALSPEKPLAEQIFLDEEDARGADEFLEWFDSKQNRDIMELARPDGDTEATDYLNSTSFSSLFFPSFSACMISSVAPCG